jgi:toxin FitB
MILVDTNVISELWKVAPAPAVLVWMDAQVLPTFTGRVFDFDLDASKAYAQLMAHMRNSGKAMSNAVGYIAATARSKSLTVATRNVAPFEAAGLTVINPWSA